MERISSEDRSVLQDFLSKPPPVEETKEVVGKKRGRKPLKKSVSELLPARSDEESSSSKHEADEDFHHAHKRQKSEAPLLRAQRPRRQSNHHFHTAESFTPGIRGKLQIDDRGHNHYREEYQLVPFQTYKSAKDQPYVIYVSPE